MRVITGELRGKKLKEPSNYDIRPTTDMVKEAIFNIIQFDIEGRRVLDLFAGTGQLGIECLSRGAESVTFVDQSKEAVSLVKSNLKSCGVEARVVQDDSIAFLSRGGKFFHAKRRNSLLRKSPLSVLPPNVCFGTPPSPARCF